MKAIRSIKTKLLIFGLSISLIPISTITTIYYLNARSMLREQILQDFKAIAESKKIHTISFIEAKKGRTMDFGSDGFIRDSLETIARKGYQSQTVANLNSHLNVNKKPLDPHILAIAIVNLDGKVISSTNETMIGMDMSKHEIYINSISKDYGEIYIGQSYKFPYLDNYCIFISAPITQKSGEDIIGVIINCYDLMSLNEITADRVGMGETGESYIVNRDKIMLTESRFIKGVVLNQMVDTEPVREIVKSGKGMTGIYSDYRGVSIVGASTYIPEYGWTLLAEIDKAEAFAPLHELGIIVLIVGSVCGAVAIGMGIFFSISTARPINKMKYAAERISSGNLKYRVEIDLRDEIGELANSFNTMADELTKKNEELMAENTERKQIEEKLRKSEQNYRNIFEKAMDGIVTGSLQGDLVTFNNAFVELTGYLKEELLNMRYQDLTPPEYHDMEAEKVKILLETGEPQEYEKEYIRKDGTRVPLLLKVSAIHDDDGKPKLLMAVIKDMTKIKRAEEALFLHSKILENMNEGVNLVKASDGIIVYTNTQFNNLFGYEHGELVGRHVSVLNAPVEVTPEEKAKEIIRELNDNGNWAGEICNIRKDGTAFWCRANVSRFNHPEYGEVWVSVHEDITKRKNAEEQIKASLKEKEVLLNEIHHRVKNNLQVISSLLDMSSMQTQNQETIELFAESRNRVESMALIHSQLYESERFDEIDMERHIQELSGNLLKIYSKEKTITLDINSANVYLPVTQAVPCALVLNELISNSLKHAYRDGQQGTISISMQQSNNGTTLLKVKDNGAGIPEEIDIERTKSLGLKLARNIVNKQLNGKIKIIRNRGTELTIEFKHSKEDS